MERQLSVRTKCPLCGKENEVILHDTEIDLYCLWQQNRMLIQDALPNRTAEEREQLKTGICPKCWNDCFGGDDENEDA